MKQKICFFLIFNCLLFLNSRAQDIYQTLELANNSKDALNYTAAVSFYERVLFFDTEQELYPEVCHNIADCYLAIGDYAKAIKYYSLAANLSKDDSLRNQYSLQKIESLILNQNYAYAYIELLEIEGTNKGKENWELFAAVSSFGMENYSTAKQHFLNLIPKNNKEDSLKIEALFKKLEKYHKRLRPKRARWMSYLVPGMGQIYSGNIKNALNSILLNGILIYITIELSATYHILDALLATVPWIQRYYFGGAINAEQSCKMQLAKRKTQVYQQLLEILE